MLHKVVVAQKRAQRLRYNALVAGIASDRFVSALKTLRALVEKANFNPQQPRLPPGGPGGGQWVHVEGYAQGRRPGIGHNGGPRLDPPDIPKDPPKDPKARLQTAKAVAKWLAINALRRAGPVGAVITALEVAHWLYSEYPSIRSYRDGPKTIEELQLGARETRPGYQKHHIVEQTPARNDRFPDSMIDGSANIVSIPTYKHREITGWYARSNPEFGGLSPRDYLKDKSWEERMSVGLRALRDTGVLKP